MSAELGGGRYRLGEVLGAGGMATVYRAMDERLHRPVAIKILADNLATDPAFRARFTQEARLAARLSHRNLVQVFDVGEEAGRPYIVMELVDGPTLGDELARRGPFPPAEVRQLAGQICAGLQSAHDAGLVHRDVKPGNLLLAPDGVVKIADFGIARVADATRITRVGDMVGTAAYIAPEQAAGQAGTAATDLYQLGVVMTELATGERPDTLGQAPPIPDPQLAAVIRQCLAGDPADRPASAAAVAAALGAGATSTDEDTKPLGGAALAAGRTQTMPAPTEAPPSGASPLRRRWPLVVVAAAAAIILLVLLAIRDSHQKHAAAPPTTVATVTTTIPPTTTSVPPAATAVGCGATDYSGRSLLASNFSNCDLRGARFDGANLVNVSFRNAELQGSSFQGASLTSVDFRNADLTGANFAGARLLVVNWKGATCPDGSDADENGGCALQRTAKVKSRR